MATAAVPDQQPVGAHWRWCRVDCAQTGPRYGSRLGGVFRGRHRRAQGDDRGEARGGHRTADTGEIDDTVLRRVQHRLDIEELRLSDVEVEVEVEVRDFETLASRIGAPRGGGSTGKGKV